MDKKDYDPVFLRCRREAIVVISIFFITMVYTEAVAYFLGYNREPEEIDFFLGMPVWAVFGVFLPWIVMLPVTAWLCFRFIKDADLGDEGSPSDIDGDETGEEE